ncbi:MULTISPECIES: aromatase/cyclase [Streptomyces]|uniref:Multifunctional cyclase-dehydratase-3-O-methyl transferase TcmN n=1 Tax=Streptomyces chartreusis NRRL 3882 TaxID=1079985 RepID=A0A2N9B385_STRCX|nr:MULTISPECIES: aromatase/cyclase [Streptomyces]MYS89687.1 cyclase [Streptomyces sp. SID5464]SOR77812.1 Multifunctional cyclase-dehydratase-3-O-methyl transferase TcmN [Streptomyces chartreusis NRRL 3882]
MNGTTLHRTEHSLTIAAPADELYAVVADVTRWPAVFEPTVAVRHLERVGRTERFQIWAEVNGRVVTWRSTRVLDGDRRVIIFHQEHSAPPFARMSGAWFFRASADGSTEVVLRHRFAVADPGALADAERALEANSTRELNALAGVVASGHPVDEVTFSFTDTMVLERPVEETYAFVEHAERWERTLPHVTRVVLEEPAPGVQHLEMDTAVDGTSHTTRSVRICRQPGWIAYKQRVTPPLLAGHSGEWIFESHPEGTLAVARHTVTLRPEAIPRLLGPGASVADARAHVREALGRNSRATLGHAAAVTAEARA